MSCYHPMLGMPDYDSGKNEKGNWTYKIEGSWNPDYRNLYPGCIKIPCGKCIGCRLDKAREWSDRMMYELQSNDGKGIFLTLTYNNDSVPLVVSEEGEFFGFDLDLRDLQLFFKRFRRAVYPRKVRYYAVGEYGAKTKRPHYHAIIFGIGLCDLPDCSPIGRNELGQVYYFSEWLQDIWSNGFIGVSDVSYKTFSYVARYTMKKSFGVDVPEGFSPEFSVMSRRPGLGRLYLDSHPDILTYSKVYFKDSNGSVEVGIPHYFLDQLKLTNPEFYRSLIEERRKLSSDAEFLKLRRTSLSYIDQLELEEEQKLNKTEILFKRREV